MNKKLMPLKKNEDADGYAERANKGLMLAHPVKINGQSHRPDNGVEYHSTIKEFNRDKDHPHAVHQLAQHLPLNSPDAKNTQIEPSELKGRDGSTVYILKLKGNSAEKMKEHNAKFSHMGHPQSYEYQAHISVPKDIHEKIKSSGAKTAHEAGISFGDAQLKQGPKTLKTYHHEPDSAEPKVPDESDFTAKVKVPVTKAEDILGEKPLMKPYVSEAQRKWAHTISGKEALGGETGVHEWDEATKGKKLPERVRKPLEKTFDAADPKKPGISTVGANVRALNSVKTPAGRKKAIQAVKEGMSHIDKPAHEVVNGWEKLTSDSIKDAYKNKPKVRNYGNSIPEPKMTLSGDTKTITNTKLAASEKNNLCDLHKAQFAIKTLIKNDKDLSSKFSKALTLSGKTMKHYIEDNKILKDAVMKISIKGR
jgi:hypothetical protein